MPLPPLGKKKGKICAHKRKEGFPANKFCSVRHALLRRRILLAALLLLLLFDKMHFLLPSLIPFSPLAYPSTKDNSSAAEKGRERRVREGGRVPKRKCACEENSRSKESALEIRVSKIKIF